MAGVADGAVYLLSAAIGGSPSGATRHAYFHEIREAGAGPISYMKSTLSWNSTGQHLGTSSRFGLNGHRIDNHGFLDIDRSTGPRRGWLYFISNRNPNPSNPALDQGDVHLSVSSDGAATWSTSLIPAAAGKTQFFPQMDVDDQGWLHVAYYQNESGREDGGVPNASAANLYYMLSKDGGAAWTSPLQANSPVNTLNLPDPPPDRSAQGYYLIGDYAQIQTSGKGSSTKASILWTGYDQTRSGSFLGDSKERVLCTTLTGVAPMVGLLFQDSFNRLNAPVLGSDWTPEVGTFSILNNRAHGAPDQLSLATVNAISEVDVSLQTWIDLGAIGVQYGGLVARLAGTGFYWGALINNNGEFIAAIDRYNAGGFTVLSGAAVSIGAGRLRFEVAGSSLKLFLDNTLATSAADSALSTPGLTGLLGIGGVYDNFSLESAIAPSPSPFSPNPLEAIQALPLFDRPWSLLGNSAGSCFRGKGPLARREERAWPPAPVTGEQRSHRAFSAKTLRGGGSFAGGLRGLGRYSPLRGCSGHAKSLARRVFRPRIRSVSTFNGFLARFPPSVSCSCLRPWKTPGRPGERQFHPYAAGNQ